MSKDKLSKNSYSAKNLGGEYEKLNSLFQKIVISHHLSRHHTHQQNGTIERKHHHITEVDLALLASQYIHAFEILE